MIFTKKMDIGGSQWLARVIAIDIHFHFQKDGGDMAKNRVKPGDKDYGKVNFRGFVKVYLKPQEKQLIKDNLLDAAGAMAFVEELTDSGYKFSFSRSSDGKTGTATAYCNDFRMANAGLGISMRHGDFLVALTALQWVINQEGLQADWSEVYGVDNDSDW